jgi:hypothetical protein
MAQFVIENFANGLDLRRSHDTAPPGSLRTLNNAFINEGGEIEKRKAFVIHAALTAYGQTANYKGKIAGPWQVGNRNDAVIFRHRHNSLPSTGWVAGAGTLAMRMAVSTKPMLHAWAMKSTVALGAGFGSCFRVNAACPSGDYVYVVESYQTPTFTPDDNQQIEVQISNTFTDNGEPIAETHITANNNFMAMAVLKDKGYNGGGNTFKASAVGDPGDMAGTGSGSIDVRSQGLPIGTVYQLGEYFGQLLVCGQKGTQFWDVDASFAQNQYLRTIPNSLLGSQTNGARSVTGYGDGDVLFLSRSGIRSMQARDSSNFAKVSDVGSPIDALIKTALNVADAPNETTDGSVQNANDFFHTAIGVVHGGSGQFWLFLKEKVYVLSNYPSAKVRAWSTFDMPTPTPANLTTKNGVAKGRWCGDACSIRDDIVLRNFADEVYFYGGTDTGTYDTSAVEVITPHMDMGRPSSIKQITGFDIACVGTWTLEASLNPQNIAWETVATFTNSTFCNTGIIPYEAKCSHMALRLTNSTAEKAILGQIIVLYEGGVGEEK